jgi:CheY-like chemotaxis protein
MKLCDPFTYEVFMPLRILVVEDEETNMKIISISLQTRGHVVIEAYEPEAGLAMARELQPDLILMDLMFKRAAIDGVEAIRRLKADPATAAIPILAQTASVLDYSELAVRGAGAEGFIRKPFRRQELLEAIEATMTERDAAALIPHVQELRQATARLKLTLAPPLKTPVKGLPRA